MQEEPLTTTNQVEEKESESVLSPPFEKEIYPASDGDKRT
jgi:hypothetical protein